MPQTVIPAGHALARKIYSVAAFAATQRAPSFSKTLIGPAPQQSDAEKKLKGQTSQDFPIVRVTDLEECGRQGERGHVPHHRRQADHGRPQARR